MTALYVEFEPGKKHASGRNAATSHDLNMFRDAGYKLTDNDLIVDIDNLDKSVIQEILTTFNIATHTVWTDRGVHLYFKKPTGFYGARGVTPLGFEVEYKHINNTSNGITVKRNGVARTVENEGVREDIPPVLYIKKKLTSLQGMVAGEGRNNALFAHRTKIQQLDGWKTMMRFLNTHILADPMSDEELDLLTRDGLKVTAEKGGEAGVAEFMVGKYNITRYNGLLYFNLDGVYENDEHKLRRLTVAEVGDMKMNYLKEVIEQMHLKAKLVEGAQKFPIRLDNGILRDGHFIEVEYEDFTPYRILTNYEPAAQSVALVDQYLEHLSGGDAGYRDLILEMMAHSLIVDPRFKGSLAKFFIFVGDGGNGKGTFLDILRRILGSHNCAALSMENLADERYLVQLEGKLVNLGDDIEDKPLNTTIVKILKNLATCDIISTRRLFEQSREVRLTTSLIFTSNHILKSFEKGHALKRRIVWLPMYGKPKNPIADLVERVTTPEALEYWMSLIVEAYERLHMNGEFTIPEVVTAFNDDYHKVNNNILLYIEDVGLGQVVGHNKVKAYEAYEFWAEDSGFEALSKKLFMDTMKTTFGLTETRKSLNGRQQRVYATKDGDTTVVSQLPATGVLGTVADSIAQAAATVTDSKQDQNITNKFA